MLYINSIIIRICEVTFAGCCDLYTVKERF